MCRFLLLPVQRWALRYACRFLIRATDEDLRVTAQAIATMFPDRLPELRSSIVRLRAHLGSL
jgi:hypothetical protein